MTEVTLRIVCTSGPATLAFDNPETVFVATRTQDVAATFAAADRAVASGTYVAGFATYEAGVAFVPRQQPIAKSEVPFVALGVYRAPRSIVLSKPEAGAFALGPLVPERSRTDYDAAVSGILDRIRSGDVYQVNLAAPFTFAFEGDPYALFSELAYARSFPYSAYADYGRFAIVSCSPELFVRFEDERLVSKPMKGTATADDPRALASAKNRAEHVMIVDLLRNDMHRLAKDVVVERLAEVERYPSFSTMTSTLEARRERPFELGETFAAMFPCGSITGAPKVTAMCAIAELEPPRGAFCGSIGYRAPDGTGTWNVAIRTATIDRTRARGTVHVGGGIVADSAAREEWAEILIKRRFLDRIAPSFCLIETLLRERDGRYRNLGEHLARMAASADALHFAFDEARVRALLADDRIAGAGGELIVRVALDREGDVRWSTRAPGTELDGLVVLSTQTLDPSDPLQRHKTDWRPHYDAAFAEARARGAFDALLRTREGYIADGSRTNVFAGRADGAPLRTPPLTDGALPGVLRAQLIATGKALEGRLTAADLADARELYLGSSVRGLRRVRYEV